MFQYKYNDIDFAHKLNGVSSIKEDFQKHVHSFYELILFVKGKCEYHIEGKKKILNEGDFILIHPGNFHFASVDESVPYERYVLKFPSSFIPVNLLQRINQSGTYFQPNTYVANIVKNLDLYYNIFSTEDCYSMFKTSIIQVLVFLLYVKESQNIYKNDYQINKVLEYINEHIYEDLTREDISKALGFSKTYANKLFKDKMNVSLMRYIKGKRILLASEMIKKGMPINEVYTKLNYKDYSTFYRAYIEIVGISPSQQSKNSIKNKQ